MKKILICQHGGSKNHGCEALARTVYAMIRVADPKAQVTLYTYSMPQDMEYLQLPGLRLRGLKGLPGKYSLYNIGYHLKKRAGVQSASKLPLTREFKSLVEESDLVIAIGGDNYCYNQGQGYWALDRYIASRGKRYMLLGCSIEPEDLSRGLGEHLKLFSRITVRESISMEAMQAYGLENAVLVPDSAFLLEAKSVTGLPYGFVPSRGVGINFSPLVMRNEKKPGMTLDNFIRLAKYILDKTDMQIALIPHVTWQDSDDGQALAALRQALGRNDRVFMLPEYDARAAKGIIGSLRFFVGARTHATIAAYSSCVPTLTLGYSVKARGIAKDLFGSEEGYVLPVQALEHPDQLTQAFAELQRREDDMRSSLIAAMPGYQEHARQVADWIREQLHD